MTVCTAGVRTVCYGRIARGGFTALHQTAALCKSGLDMWRKTAPINAFLICCTGITPYNVIIHPDPGFVKYFLKFKHNIPAHRVGRELAGGKLLFIGYMLIYSFPQTKRRTAPGSPPVKISYNLLRTARNRTAYDRSIIYNAGHTYSRQRKRYILSLGLRLNAGDNDRRYR